MERWELRVYTAAGALAGTLQTARNISWLDDGTGTGQLTFLFDAEREAATDLVQGDRQVRVYDTRFNAERFAGVVRTQVKTRTDGSRAETAVTCYGLRDLFTTAIVYPGDLTVAGLGAAVRTFGWQSAEYVTDGSWTSPASHGLFSADPFGDGRPQDWPAQSSEYIWQTGSLGTAAAGDCYFRHAFNTTTVQDIVVCASADDEYDLWLDGVLLLSSRGAYQWNRFQQVALQLPAGDHVVGVRGRNFQRNGSNSVGWIMAAGVAADAAGQPAQTDETYEVHVGTASGGTFTLTFDAYGPTAAIAYNASAATVKAALDALVASIDVSVTGTGTSGDPWVIVCDGDDIQGVGHTITGDGSSLTPSDTLSVTNTVDGAWADVVFKSDTTWEMLAYPASAPGMTFGQILNIMIDEAQARGALTGLTAGFTDTVDSDGTAWSTMIEFGVPVGSDIEQAIRALEDAGLDLRVRADGTVDAGEDLGADVSDTVALTWGTNVAGATHTRDGFRVDRLLIETPEGWSTKEVASPSDPQRELHVQAGAFPTDAAFDTPGDYLLAEYDTQADNGMFTVPAGWEIDGTDAELYDADGTRIPQPYIDFDVFDLISATDWQREQSKQRVLSVSRLVDEDGQIQWTVQTADTGAPVTQPVVESEAALQETDGNIATINAPSGIEEGDLLIVVADLNRLTATPQANVTGFTLAEDTVFQSASSHHHRSKVWWKIADVGDVGASTFALDSQALTESNWWAFRLTGGTSIDVTGVTGTDTTNPRSTQATKTVTPGSLTLFAHIETGNTSPVVGDFDVTGGTVSQFLDGAVNANILMVGSCPAGDADVTVTANFASSGATAQRLLLIEVLQ